ncbi:Response regulator receiver domain-containing protein [Paraburkholderia fungorum]|uniref:Response regulator receiver domain-containing protein n=1 Tax=Paraburkholderia fungorum TaxID=134537 RepID=A0A1H1JWK9_9BURK|nr:response regulator [Paraburkholderia fungorum]SDR54045.1 Response regulator receiver domain-containing protein [Paraburkholderia fungorum]
MSLPDLLQHKADPWTTRRAKVNCAALRVLVVDDDEHAALAVATYLSAETLDSRAAFGGLEAVDASRVWEPHIILMDLTMPHLDGYHATHALRQDTSGRDTVIIAHTALDETEVRRHEIAAGDFDAYLRKGRSPAQLIALLRFFGA